MSKQKTDPKWYKPNGKYFNPLNVKPKVLKPSKKDWEKIRFKFSDCAITGRPLNDNHELDHDHQSHFCRGYLCPAANHIMGILDKSWSEKCWDWENPHHATQGLDMAKIIYRKADQAVSEYIQKFKKKYDTSFFEENRKEMAMATLRYKLHNWQHMGLLIVYPQDRIKVIEKFIKMPVKAQRAILHYTYGLPWDDSDTKKERVKTFRTFFMHK